MVILNEWRVTMALDILAGKLLYHYERKHWRRKNDGHPPYAAQAGLHLHHDFLFQVTDNVPGNKVLELHGPLGRGR